jgi:hypothetical protein
MGHSCERRQIAPRCAELQPQRAECAVHREGAEALSSASDDEVGGLYARLREQVEKDEA